MSWSDCRNDRYLYFIQGGVDGPFKVGISARVEARLDIHQASSPVPLRLVRVIAGCSQFDERRLLDELAPHRLYSEWFANVPEVRAYALEQKRVP